MLFSEKCELSFRKALYGKKTGQKRVLTSSLRKTNCMCGYNLDDLLS
jgi:hypothetical protein